MKNENATELPSQVLVLEITLLFTFHTLQKLRRHLAMKNRQKHCVAIIIVALTSKYILPSVEFLLRTS